MTTFIQWKKDLESTIPGSNEGEDQLLKLADVLLTRSWMKDGFYDDELPQSKKSHKMSQQGNESDEDKAARIAANRQLLVNLQKSKTASGQSTTRGSVKSDAPTKDGKPDKESEHVRKVREREAAESKARAEEERVRREKIANDRKARANASAKPYTAPGVSHKSKDAGDVEAAPGASAQAKRTAKKAVDVESIARHVEALKIAENERVAVEEAKLELRRIGKAIGGS